MAIEDAPMIDIPKVDEAEAYDENRPISSLIRTQLLHLHQAEARMPDDKQTNININHLLTERQASEYIAAVTALLHQHGKAGAKRKTKKKTVNKSRTVAKKTRPAAKATKKHKSPAKTKKSAARRKKRG